LAIPSAPDQLDEAIERSFAVLRGQTAPADRRAERLSEIAKVGLWLSHAQSQLKFRAGLSVATIV
jgi:hypothetical protein